MPVNESSTSLMSDFDNDVFDYELYDEKTNDCYCFNELCLKIGFSEHIDVLTWNDQKFYVFIQDIKQHQNSVFNYKIETTQNSQWTYKADKNEIHMTIWDYGKPLTYAFVVVTDKIITKLESIYNGVIEFKKRI